MIFFAGMKMDQLSLGRMGIETILLNLLGLIFVIVWVVRTVKDFKQTQEKRKFFTPKRFLKIAGMLVLVGIPITLVTLLFPETPSRAWISPDNMGFVVVAALVLAYLISGIWFRYVRKLDIFEQEKRIHLILVFVFSCFSTVIIGLIGYGFFGALGLPEAGSNNPVYDFFYCVIVIGGVEETAKLLPILAILLFFRKAINEPYDFILYGSISALGFAFVENAGYIYESQLQNIGGRMLYATVAHMTFTSTACYGMMLTKFKFNQKPAFLVITFYFLMAMVAHGFYDFWLINEFVNSLGIITVVFFLVSVHIWTTEKNNALNMSAFFQRGIKVENDKLRYFLIFSLTGMLMLGYIAVALVQGSALANEYLVVAGVSYGYMVFYLAFGLTRYRILHNRRNPLNLPFKFLFPLPVDTSKPPPPPDPTKPPPPPLSD